MRSRFLSFVPLAVVIVLVLVGAAACTRAKPNRPIGAAPTSAPLPTVAGSTQSLTTPTTQSATAPVTPDTLAQTTPIPLEPSPTMVPGMPTSTVPPSESTPAVELIVPLTPPVEATAPPVALATADSGQLELSDLGPTKSYTVKEGDTLFNLSVQFGTAVETLKQINSLSSDMLTVGQEIRVPVAPSPSIPAATGAPAKSAPGGRVYVVRAGDNLFRIALKYGVSLDALAQANTTIVAPWYTIYAGQRLVIP